MQKIKGGAVILPQGTTYASLIQNINGLTILGVNSSGGYLMRGTLNNPYTGLFGGSQNIITNVNEVII